MKRVKLFITLIATMASMNVTAAQDDSIEGAWEVNQSDQKRLHDELDPFIKKIFEKAEFESEAARAAAPAKVFKAFSEQKFWFYKHGERWEQETEMNGIKVKLVVSIEKTDAPNKFRILNLKKKVPTFIVTVISKDAITLTSINDKISFPMIRQKPQKTDSK
jgi:hypothetical protein